MRIWGFTAAAALCAGLTLSSAQVQQPKVKTPAPKTSKAAPKPASAADQNPPEPTISVDITRVNILFTVTDKKGRFITDLGQDDFDVAENKKPQSILQFAAESDLPLRIAVLIDTSNSITDRFRFEQQAAIRFMNSVMRPRQDLMMLAAFDSNVEMVTDLTDDMKALEAGIRSMRPGGGTSMYDAIYYAAGQKLMMDQPRDKFRRAMIIISDGVDTSSDHTRDQALEMAQKADTVIYAISTNITREDREGDKVLRYFTDETGGQAFFPFKAEDLDQSFENIANVLRHQYNIFYSPNPLVRDGLYHPVALKVKTRKDLVVRARKGYYAPHPLTANP
jgi:VWFA-related protein